MKEVIPVAEFHRRLKAQGVERKHLAFVCPKCGTVQSMSSLIAAGCDEGDVEKYVGFSCVGRFAKASGCDWTLGGLFRIHELEIQTDDGKTHPHFKPASPTQAQQLRDSAVSAPSAVNSISAPSSISDPTSDIPASGAGGGK